MKREIKSFEDALAEIEGLVADLGDEAEGLTAAAAAVITTGPSAVPAKLACQARRAAERAPEIADLAAVLLAKRQAAPRELRRLVSAIRVTDDHARIARLAGTIAERSGLSESLAGTPSLAHAIVDLSQLALDQVRAVVAAQRDHDDARCRWVWNRDGVVDAAYADALMAAISALATSPQTNLAVFEAIMCANQLERICDHARNVADMVHFSATGRHLGLAPHEPRAERKPEAA